jgi:hypothetical protein
MLVVLMTTMPAAAVAFSDVPASHPYGAAITELGDPHRLVLPEEHSRTTSTSRAAGCDACHPLPAAFDWTGECADCHRPGGAAPVRHLSEGTVHQSRADCGGSGCHATDVRTVHQAAAGCATCHSTSAVPTTTDCVSCHGAGPHVVRAPFKDTCDKCHSIGGPGGSLHDRHAVKENVPCATCHGASAPGCVAASCHEHSLDKIHEKDDHSPCTACHLGGPPSG